jgi:hypothetical protein
MITITAVNMAELFDLVSDIFGEDALPKTRRTRKPKATDDKPEAAQAPVDLPPVNLGAKEPEVAASPVIAPPPAVVAPAPISLPTAVSAPHPFTAPSPVAAPVAEIRALVNEAKEHLRKMSEKHGDAAVYSWASQNVLGLPVASKEDIEGKHLPAASDEQLKALIEAAKRSI